METKTLHTDGKICERDFCLGPLASLGQSLSKASDGILVGCPRLNGELYRVFCGPGQPQQWPLPRTGSGGPILYSNFRNRYWRPAFKAAGVGYVTQHSARHNFVSTLQAQGVEVGFVTKLAGHAKPTVTLGHYTQAVRGGMEAVAVLDAAYRGEGGGLHQIELGS